MISSIVSALKTLYPMGLCTIIGHGKMCTFLPISLPCRRIFCDLTPQIVCQYHLIKRWFCKIIAAHHYFSFSHFDKEYKIKPYNKARDLRHFTASFASFHRVICL